MGSENGQSDRIDAKEAAALMGVTTQRVYEMTGLDMQKGPDGNSYSRRAVEQTIERRRFKNRAETYDEMLGRVASLAFAEFDAGASTRDVVKKLAVSPDLVERIHAQYHRLGGAMVLSTDDLRAIYSLPLVGHYPVTDGKGLAELFKENLSPSGTCTRCKRRPASLCAPCGAVSSKEK